MHSSFIRISECQCHFEEELKMVGRNTNVKSLLFIICV